MENLNAEEVKKGLECCSKISFCGSECPYYEEGGCVRKVTGNALALITSQEQRIAELEVELKAMRGAANAYKMHNKQLTEENARLRAENKTVAKRTVRKFVKMLKSHDCRCDSCINEIKKEIENEN